LGDLMPMGINQRELDKCEKSFRARCGPNSEIKPTSN
jgi:hypothetical protein